MLNSLSLRQPFPRFALIAAITILVLFWLCCLAIARQHGVSLLLGWTAQPRGDKWVVTEVDEEGPAAEKVRPGDRLLAINGSGRILQFAPSGTLAVSSGSGTYSVEVSRRGQRVHLTLPLWRRPDQTWRDFSYLILAAINLGVAIWIGAARPDYGAAQVAFFLFLAIARAFEAAVLQDFHASLTDTALLVALLFGSLIWRPLEYALAFDFALRFPQPLPQPRVLRWLRFVLYSGGLLLWSLGMLPLLAYLLHMPERSALLPSWFPLAGFDARSPALADALGVAALLGLPLTLARNYRKLPDALERRRVRWVVLGIGLAAIPIALEIAMRLTLRTLGHSGAKVSEGFFDTAASFFSALAPLTLAYAIVKHRVLGIQLVIRKGVQYVLAKNVLRIILWLPLIAIAIDVLLHPTEQLQEFLLHRSLWFYVFVIASASVSLRYRHRLQLWVDRKFFRSAYEEEAILSDLIDSMHACESSDEVARVVALKIEASLQPVNISVLYRKGPGEKFTVGYPHGAPIALQFRGILNERIQDALQTQRCARTFTEIAAALKDNETAANDLLRNTLLTPVSGSGGNLFGVLLLDEKKSEQSYSSRDRRLLQSVATQMGLVLEMLALKERVRDEGRVRIEVLGRLDQERIQLVLECPECGRCYTSPQTRCETDGNSLGLTLPIERTIDGKYRLERRIGAGGMGAVYEASDLRLDRTVAVKVMTGRLFGNNTALRRFEREARAAARLQHANIVAIYDFGSLRGDGAYLVMQRIKGQSWRTETSRMGQIKPPRAGAWFDQLCEAMACAHASGVIHRDLKPENVLVSLDGAGSEKITVLDFGIAKLYDFEKTDEPDLTSVDRVLGTYEYMSPEQRMGAPVDARTDVYAIGVMAVEMLTGGRPPGSGASRKWLQDTLQWPEPTPAGRKVTELLDRCLSESLSERLCSIEELQRDLIPLLGECPQPISVRAGSDDGAATVTKPG